jgi:hypothetical protein
VVEGKKGAGPPELGEETAAPPLAARGELAGVAHSGATGHGSTNGGYRERVEAKAITTMPFARPGKARCGTHHGWQWRKLTRAHGDSPSGHD